MAIFTRPNISPVFTFLTLYSNASHPQHYKATVHALKYITITNEYGISFQYKSSSTIQAFNHFSHNHNKEANTEATAPSLSEFHKLMAFCDANWGGQFVNEFKEGTPLGFFKSRSLSGFLVCRSGGPIAWKSIRQNQTGLSSCESKILATNKCAT